MKVLKKSLSIIAFLAILSFCIFSVTEIISAPTGYINNTVNSFNNESDDKVDAVVLGTSVVSYGYFPTVAFNEYGISSYNFGSDVQPAGTIQSILDFVKSNQDIKYVVIDVHGFRKSAIIKSTGGNGAKANKGNIQKFSRSIPFGKYRFNIINSYIDFSEKVYEYYGYPEDSKQIVKRDDISLYIPFYSLHNRWITGIKKDDFVKNTGKYKGGFSDKDIFSTKDCSKLLDVWTGKETELDDFQMSLIDELLEYLDQQDFQSLFINYPSFRSEEDESECLTILNYIERKGYNTLNLSGTEAIEKIGIDLKTDFYNTGHVNSKGGIKTTRYICSYVKELFEEDYVDHRGEEGYESWDKAIDNYCKFLKSGWKDATKEEFDYTRQY